MTNATIVLVTKFPTKGVSKTRLYSTLGEEATFALAKAMLSDLLNTFSSPQLSTSDVGRKILYIPERSISDAYEFCQSVCPQYENWNICAMDNGLGSATLDLSSSNLTTVLTNALRYSIRLSSILVFITIISFLNLLYLLLLLLL